MTRFSGKKFLTVLAGSVFVFSFAHADVDPSKVSDPEDSTTQAQDAKPLGQFPQAESMPAPAAVPQALSQPPVPSPQTPAPNALTTAATAGTGTSAVQN